MFYCTYVFILMISSRILENKTLIFQIQLWPPWTHCGIFCVTDIQREMQNACNSSVKSNNACQLIWRELC
jgi:hypothetical protein